MRICSFLPSATEIVYTLGLGDQLYGVTHECDYPPEARKKPVIVRSAFDPSKYTSPELDAEIIERIVSGRGIYEVDVDILREVQPDLVLTQELCDVCAVPTQVVAEAIKALPRQPMVLSLDPKCLDDVLKDILRVGEATDSLDRAEALVAGLRERIDKVVNKAALADRKPRVACIEWLDPIIYAGHWIPDMVDLASGVSCFGRKGEPSGKIEWQQVIDSNAEVIIVMPCGFDVKRGLQELHFLTQREGWHSLPAVQQNQVFVTDASAYFSRSGPRLVDGLEIMAEIIHPQLFSSMAPEGSVARLYGELFKVS